MLRIEKEWFIDKEGRRVLLRGVNLGGSTKVPAKPDGATHIKTDFSQDVSFVGRPFPLKAANEHFSRIRHWGFNSIRFLTTWEAIEHDNPKQYDIEYLDYVEEVLKIAEEHKIYTIIDPHQDVWSRVCGGDGAPIWTFEKVGLDISKFDASEAAFVMQHRFNPEDESAYPPMSWPQNYRRFANGTMWTLFFAGRDFAPSCKIGKVSAQDYLQQHYFNALKQVAKRLKDNPYVIGFETLNEPGTGWIGQKVDGSDISTSTLMGSAFTPFDAMLTAAGHSRTIPFFGVEGMGIKELRRDLLNPEGFSCWLKGAEDIWLREGVWGYGDNGEPEILQNNYFEKVNGRPVDFIDDYFSPFVKGYASAIREIIPSIPIYLVPPPIIVAGGGERLPRDLPDNVVNASHWYDGPTIGTKIFMDVANIDVSTGELVMGEENIRTMFLRALAGIKEVSAGIHGGVPTVIGEFGLCFDLEKGAAYKKWKENPEGAWATHIRALARYYDVMDIMLLHTMHWNYTADNTVEWGDQWNQEDFSIFSYDHQTDPKDISSGGRAIEGFCRPHFVAVAGTPTKMEFSLQSKEFRFEFHADTKVKAPTKLYVPEIQYPEGFDIEFTPQASFTLLETTITRPDGSTHVTDPQHVTFRTHKDGVHTVVIKPKKKPT